MDNKSKAKKSKNSVASSTSYHNFFSSKHTMEKKLVCSGCEQEFVVPTKTTSYRCYKCKGVSKSRENSLGAKLLNQRKLDHAGRIGSGYSSSTIFGNKRAVLCGVSYSRRSRYRLEGTINDVVNMKSLLVDNFAFPTQSVRVLTEEQKDPNFSPTRKNIMESLKWLVKDCKSGDSLVFYFSGHGMQQAAHDKEDEIDGLDETICPVDFIRSGMITDNEINSTIVGPLKNGVKLHAFIDACHSGTTLDLMHVYKKDIGNWKWMDNNPHNTKSVTKSTAGGMAICISACEDYQIAADTAAFGGKQMNGVMTYLLTNIIRQHYGITYAALLEKLHHEIGKIQQNKHFNRLLKRIFRSKIDQDPLLSSSAIFDVNTRISL
ncbi:unnamed protein product [Vicia faba]|uniref:Peptidase C14 caspase domain-containing protein n=1 Tax=Vicia faba TaxID=3906 RepID=A0AAV0Z018_VICFA|nr:unnamed protein product [Vicia faba]